MPVTSNPPCQAEACAIQDCLGRYQFQQDRCEDVVFKLYDCCSKMYDEPGRTSTACPKPEVVARKLKDREGKS